MALHEMIQMKHEIEEALGHDFWTRFEEMVEGIDGLLYENEIPAHVGFATEEYITIDSDEDDVVFVAYIGHANNTRWIERVVLG